MNGVLVRKYWDGSDETMWLLEMLPTSEGIVGVCVADGGRLLTFPVEQLQVDRPTVDFPIGYRFSRWQAEGAAVKP